MALNIKSEEAHELARQVAAATGTSLTEAVTRSLRRALETGGDDADATLLLARVSEIQEFVAQLPDRSAASPDELLGYDSLGLPG